MTAKEYIESYTKRCSNETTKYGCYDHTYQPWLTPENALAAVEIEREEIIRKAREWLDEHIWDYIETGFIGDFTTLRNTKFGDMLEDFCKAMKGE